MLLQLLQLQSSNLKNKRPILFHPFSDFVILFGLEKKYGLLYFSVCSLIKQVCF